MVPWLTLYMDTCGDVGSGDCGLGQYRSCCTHSAIYIAHTLVVRTKAEYMCMHPTPTQTIRRALVQCTAVAIRARKQARRAALIIRMSHIQHPPCNWLTCDGSVVARCQVCLHGRCRPRRFPSSWGQAKGPFQNRGLRITDRGGGESRALTCARKRRTYRGRHCH